MKEVKENSQKFGESADELWEQILFGISQSDPYLKVKWLEAAKVLDKLRKHFKNKDELYKKIHGAMEFASMTSVDDAIEGKSNKKFTFTVSSFESYEAWEEQRRNEDDKLTDEIISLHKSIYNFIKIEFPDLSIKFRKHGAALFHVSGEKVGNLNAYGRNGVTLNLLRTEENGYKLPELNHKVENARNDVKNCEYYTILDIKELDEGVKSCVKKSYDVRDKKQKVLKRSHQNIKEILGLE